MRLEAARMAKHTIEVFETTTGPVVIPSGSCAAMIRHSYPELLPPSPFGLKRAKTLAGRVYEFSEFLVDHLRVVNLGVYFLWPDCLPCFLPS
jgi:L-lactate dehydrogenase complex protein LldE